MEVLKIFKNLSNKQHKIIILIIISIFITSSFLFSGCIKNVEDGYKEKPVFDKEKINNSLDKAEKWLISNLREEGYFNYIYYPSTETYSTNNNMIRQLMASRLLAEMSKDNISLQPLHQKNLDYIFYHWYKEDNDTGYILYNNKSKLGAMAMALRTLVHSPFFNDYQDQAIKLANCIFSLQNPDGSFEPWFIEPDYICDADYLLTFYSGEAILSLVEMYLKTNNSFYLDVAIESQDFYIDKYVVHLEDNYYPAYVPWHTQSLNKIYNITGNQTYANVVLILNDKLLELQNTEGPPEHLGRFYNASTPQYGTPHSSSDGIYTEGLAYAYEIAVYLNDTNHKEKYTNAITLGVQNLITLQYNNSDEKINGAIRCTENDFRIRIDTTQHTIDALRKVLEIYDQE